MNLKNIRLSDISIPCLVRFVLRNLWMVVAAALIFSMSVSLYFSWLHKPVYQANVTYAVTSRRTSYTSGSNATAAREVAAVLSEMLETDMVRQNIRSSSDQLASFSGSVNASIVEGTNFVVVTVRDGSAERAFMALQAVMDQFPDLTEYVSSNAIPQVVRNPSVIVAPVNSVNVSRHCKLAALAGAAAVVLLLCWYSIQRETIQTRSGARRMLDAHIIASVHRERRKRTVKSLLHKSDKPLQVFAPTTSFDYTEQINTICTRMEQEFTARGSKVFMITSVGENEGKSTIAGNVSAALALMGKSVAIVDCDLRNPSLNRFFDGKYSGSLPLNQMLSRPFGRENLLQCMSKHDRLGLFMLFSRSADKRCTELISGRTMDLLLRQLRVFDYVILDTPPMGFFADAEILAQKVDASMLVVRQDRTPAPDVNDSIDVLRASKSAFLGCILNDMTNSYTEGSGYGYGYGYGRRYGYGYGHYGYGSSSQSQKASKAKKK